MKAKYLGTAVLAMAAALAGCGGKTSFTISGTLSGVNNPGLVLANGSEELSIPVGATSFSFSQTVDYGNNYNVTVKNQPQYMTCTPPSTAGVAGRTESIAIVIQCVQNTHTVYVTVTGLAEVATGAAQLQLINGTTIQAVTSASPSTGFAGIPVGTSYGVTIFQQPAGQTCTIANGAGIMGDADRADTVVTCTKNA
ncbi:hypothetical protein [Massilia sp. METH4]|uniref:hypothetical protein n=1 Tax=Massilia sp. METH4 TaxID=3123041 RepID=UPI0030D47D2C